MMNCGNKINDLINKNYGSFDKEEKRKQKKLLKEQKKEEKREEKLNQIQKLSFKEYLYNIYNLLFVALGFIACLLIMLYFIIGVSFSRLENLIDNQIANEETQAYSNEFKNINEYEYKETKKSIIPYSVTNLTGTKWLLNNNVNLTPNYLVGNIEFYSNSYTFNYIRIGYTAVGFDLYGANALTYDFTTVFGDGGPGMPNGWLNNEYKTIDIIGGTDVTNNSLISWLQSNATQQSSTTQLTTPTLQFRFVNNNNYLSWIPISNATTYAVYKDNVLITDSSTTFYSDGTYINYAIDSVGTYYVVAIGDNIYYTDSYNSNSVTLPNSQLATPTLTLSSDTLSWSAITGATGYEIYKDNSLLTTISTTTYSLSSEGTYNVKAITGSLYYTNSNLSNNVTLIYPNLSTPFIEFDISYNSGAVLSWNYVTLSGLTQNFEIYKDDVLFATTQNHTYNVTQNGTYKVRQLSNLSNYKDSNFSNSVSILNLTHITYTLDNNIIARTYFDTNNSTILSDFYFILNSENLPFTIFEIDNNNASTGYVFKSVNDFTTSSNIEFDTTILNNQTIRVDYSSITGDFSAIVVDYSASKISGNTFYFYSETFFDNLVIGDYLLNDRPFTSNEREFNNIFVNSYNFLVYDNNGIQENLVYFLSNLTGQYMNNSTYNYYLIYFGGVTGNNSYFIQNYISNDDIFFDYYRLATQSDLDNISALNDQLIYINDNYTFMALFGSIIDAHFNTLKSLLNFQFFGINLWAIFTLFLTVSLVFVALKFLRGGKKE